MRHSRLLLTAAGLLLAGVAGAPAVSAKPGLQCFFARDFSNWKAADARTIYIRADSHRVFRLDLSGSCPALLWPGAHLVTRWDGSDSVCSATDWNLSVVPDTGGFREPCIVKAMTLLTPQEAAALPPKVRP